MTASCLKTNYKSECSQEAKERAPQEKRSLFSQSNCAENISIIGLQIKVLKSWDDAPETKQTKAFAALLMNHLKGIRGCEN